MTKGPLVSVIVTTKNSAVTLPACLETIAQQTYPSVELIVVDNYSTDDTQAIAKTYTKHVYVKGPERCAQRNYAASKATGEYVAIIDSDMELAPKVLTECVAKLHSNTNASGVVIHEESFGIGYWAKAKALERSFYVGVPWIEAARFFRTETFRKLGGYNETLISGEDWDLSKRAEKFGDVVAVSSMIRHNEGAIKLMTTLHKKYYYAQHARAYLNANPQQSILTSKSGPLNRYKLFLSHPIKLFRNPVVGLGVLFLKSAEFTAGASGYLSSGIKNT